MALLLGKYIQVEYQVSNLFSWYNNSRLSIKRKREKENHLCATFILIVSNKPNNRLLNRIRNRRKTNGKKVKCIPLGCFPLSFYYESKIGNTPHEYQLFDAAKLTARLSKVKFSSHSCAICCSTIFQGILLFIFNVYYYAFQ